MLTKTKLFMQICKFEVGGGGRGEKASLHADRTGMRLRLV